MATTVNGMAAKENDDTPWSQEEFAAYYGDIKRVGNVVIGRRTFEIVKNSEEEMSRIKDIVAVVVSHQKIDDEHFISVTSPQEALQNLTEKGFSEAIIGGGGELNASFLKEGLIDEMIIDVEPMVFGKGIPLFAPGDFDATLKLLSTQKLNANTVRLRYQVIR